MDSFCLWLFVIKLYSHINIFNVLPAYTCARAIGNFWSMCLGINLFNRVAKSKGCPIRVFLLETFNFWKHQEFSTFINSTNFFNKLLWSILVYLC